MSDTFGPLHVNALPPVGMGARDRLLRLLAIIGMQVPGLSDGEAVKEVPYNLVGEGRGHGQPKTPNEQPPKPRVRNRKPSESKHLRETANPEARPIEAATMGAYQQHCLKPVKQGGLGLANETTVMAYAGSFPDRADARRWFLTPPFLQALELFIKAGGPIQYARAQMIYDQSAEAWQTAGHGLKYAGDEWPVKLRATQSDMVLEDKPNAAHILAFLFYWLPKESDRYLSLSLTDQQTEYEAFTYPLYRPSWEVASNNGMGFVAPVLQHPNDIIKIAEQNLRLFGSLRVIYTKIRAYTCGDGALPFDREWEMFWQDPTVLASKPFEDYSRPLWMCQESPTKKSISEQRPRDIRLKTPKMSEHAAMLNIQEGSEEWDKLKANLKAMDRRVKVDKSCPYDPRDYENAEEWQKLLRIDLKLRLKKSKLSALAVQDQDEDETHLSFYSTRSSALLSWSQLQERVEDTTDGPITIIVYVQYFDSVILDAGRKSGSDAAEDNRVGLANRLSPSNDGGVLLSYSNNRLAVATRARIVEDRQFEQPNRANGNGTSAVFLRLARFLATYATEQTKQKPSSKKRKSTSDSRSLSLAKKLKSIAASEAGYEFL